MVAGKMADHKQIANMARNDLEGNDTNQTKRLRKYMEKIGRAVYYENLLEFAKHMRLTM